MKLFLYFILLVSLLSSCGKEETRSEVDARNEQEILDYLAENNINDAIRTETGLYVKINAEGSSQKPSLSDIVSVIYNGTLLDGTRFDGTGTPISFPLSNVILGWQEGIQYFGREGNGTLYIPSRLAYGDRPPSSSIPANAVLLFDVTVIDF